jgi:hypothetical protein
MYEHQFRSIFNKSVVLLLEVFEAQLRTEHPKPIAIPARREDLPFYSLAHREPCPSNLDCLVVYHLDESKCCSKYLGLSAETIDCQRVAISHFEGENIFGENSGGL